MRLLSMFFVTVLHTIGHGGVIDNTVGIKNDMLSLVRIIAYCAVNCYAIISGFVMYSDQEKPYRYSKYITMWIQVFFYSFGIGLLMFLIKGNDSIALKELVKLALPVSTKRYWYFSAYTGLFFIVPFVNKFVRGLSRKSSTIFVIVLFVLFVCYGRSGSFYLNSGYSSAWLIIMYMFGAWLKKCDIIQKVSCSYSWGGLIAFTLVTWLFKILSPIGENLFVSYISPTIVLNAICWILIFARMNINSIFKRIIKFLSPAAFGVYLIHEHDIIKRNFISDKFIWIAKLDWWLIPLVVLGCAFCIFAVCLFVERIRLSLFSTLRINKLAEKICYKFEVFIRKFVNKICDCMND